MELSLMLGRWGSRLGEVKELAQGDYLNSAVSEFKVEVYSSLEPLLPMEKGQIQASLGP